MKIRICKKVNTYSELTHRKKEESGIFLDLRVSILTVIKSETLFSIHNRYGCLNINKRRNWTYKQQKIHYKSLTPFVTNFLLWQWKTILRSRVGFSSLGFPPLSQAEEGKSVEGRACRSTCSHFKKGMKRDRDKERDSYKKKFGDGEIKRRWDR